MLDEARQGIVKPDAPPEEQARPKGHNFIVETLIFIAVFFVGQIAASIVMMPKLIGSYMSDEGYISLTQQYISGEVGMNDYVKGVTALDVLSSLPVRLTMLFAMGIITVLVIIFCRFIEKRKISSMGFRKNGAVKEYLVGMVIGIVILSAAVGICLLTGALTFDGLMPNISFGAIALFFVAYLVQGMSEEVLMRGYFMVSLSRRSPIALAVVISSVAFSLAHISNSNVTVLALINIFLFGVFAGVYILKRGNIWGACAIHSLWNFVQGHIYGIQVSGTTSDQSVLAMSAVNGKELISGGLFGLEGGLAVTIVLVVCTVVMLFTKTKQSELSELPETAAA